jgi:prepilin-type N-terminal cleavage/methylation domain-containing protein
MKIRIPRGFSLLELMIVIIIAAILSVLALPAFRTYFIRNSISSAANNVLAATNAARAEAIKRNVYVRVDPALCSGVGKWSYGAFVWLPASNNPADIAPTTMPDSRVLSGSAVADSDVCANAGKFVETIVSGSGNVVCYNGSGRINLNATTSACTTSATASPLQIKLCAAGGVVKTGAIIDVAASGRALIQTNVTCP